MPCLRACRRVSGALLLMCLCACASLPTDVARTPSVALVNTDDTRLGRALADRIAANPGKSGVYPLNNARDAFAARVLLTQAAERSLDLQYYIWHADTTGRLLFEAVWQAAERGVRVRMLLDDANTRGLDPTIAAFDAHPNIEVRLFNPFANRAMRLGDAITDFARVNRRMHNKAFIADNQAAIVGGRNIGDEYFDAGSAVGFVDLDVLAAGPVVREVSAEFDRYWNSEFAYPAASLVASAARDAAAELGKDWSQLREAPKTGTYIAALHDTTLVQQVLERRLPFEWTDARVVSDDPAKVREPPDHTGSRMLERLQDTLGRPSRELDLVSPYFVPGKGGVQALRVLVERGVRVRVLTNALAATDVGVVHAGYSKYRKELLRGGTRLYELKPSAEVKRHKDETDQRGIGSSSASLHAKTFGVDRSRIFVGSFNLDPRSARLNTEMGAVIDSPTLARRLGEAFDAVIPDEAYEVRLAADGDSLEWLERTGTGEVVHTSEPQSGWLRRRWIDFLSILPIEWLL